MGHLLGMKAGLGLQGLPSWSFSHTRCLSISVLLYLSPRLCLCVSLYFFLPVSPRLYPPFSVLQHLEHVVTKRRKFGFPPAWRLTPHTTGLQIISGDPGEWRQGAGLE